MLVLRKETNFGHQKVDPMGENIPVLGFPDFSFTDGTSQNVIAWGRQKNSTKYGKRKFRQ